jgi:hypothetical protein
VIQYQYHFRARAEKIEPGVWDLKIFKTKNHQVPIATWQREPEPGLFWTETHEELIYDHRHYGVTGVGHYQTYDALARRQPGKWFVWSENHGGTSLIRLALNSAMGYRLGLRAV